MACKHFLAIIFLTSQVFFSPRSAHARYYDPDVGRFTSADTIVPSAMDPQSFNRYAYVRNNPAVLTDPNGHSWLSKSIDKASNWAGKHKEFTGLAWQALDVLHGSAYLASFENGRAILAGQVIAAGAFAVGGTSAGWGAVSGEASSAYAARKSGDNMMWAVTRGGLEGAVTSATFSQISGTKMHWAAKALGKSAISAGLTKMHGGDPGSVWMSAGISFASEAANSYFTKTVGYRLSATPGVGVPNSGAGAGEYAGDIPPEIENTIGFNKALTGNAFNDYGTQGGAVSNAANLVPTMNAFSKVHDLGQNLSTWIPNFSSMPFAMAISNFILLSSDLAPLVPYYSQKN